MLPLVFLQIGHAVSYLHSTHPPGKPLFIFQTYESLFMKNLPYNHDLITPFWPSLPDQAESGVSSASILLFSCITLTCLSSLPDSELFEGQVLWICGT